MLYTPIIGVVNVHAAMIGENKKLTLEVPYFCRKNRAIRIAADMVFTAAGRFNTKGYCREVNIRKIYAVKLLVISYIHQNTYPC